MKLVFVHGAGGWGGLWWKQLAFFPDAEAVTLPGHPEGELLGSVASYADWLDAYLREKGYRETVLVGHSLGGAIIMLHALKQPETLRGIVLMATGARLRVHAMFMAELEQAVKGDIAGWVRRLREYHSRLAPEEKESLINRYREVGALCQLNDFICCDSFDIMNRIGGITVPTLVLGGEEDIMTPVKFADFLAAGISGAEKEIIPGAGHQLFLEKPDEVNQALQNFMTTLTK